MQITFFLILRSALFARVSKDGNEGARSHPSRRGQVAAPQDEGTERVGKTWQTRGAHL